MTSVFLIDRESGDSTCLPSTRSLPGAAQNFTHTGLFLSLQELPHFTDEEIEARRGKSVIPNRAQLHF